MKKLIPIILALIMLSGCTSAGKTSEGTFTESTTIEAETITEIQTITEIKTTTKAETSFPDEITLTAKLSSNHTQIRGCKVIENSQIQSESDFPNKEHIRLAKEFCWNNEYMKSELESYDEFEKDSEGYEKFTCADSLIFVSGISYDFDMDGENESIISIHYLPMSWYMGYTAVIYCNDNITTLLVEDCNPGVEVYALDFDDFQKFELYATYGGIGYSTEIYTIENGAPKAVVRYNYGSLANDYSDGVFYCYPKYGYAPELVVCDADGNFRQLDTEKITSEDLTAHVENADLLLERLSSDGNILSGIYTTGYYCYWIVCGENAFYFQLENGTAIVEDFSPDKYFSEEREYFKLTESNCLSNIDVFSLDII